MPRHVSGFIAAGLLLTSIITLISAVGLMQRSERLQPLSIAVSRTPLSAPVYIAAANGYFRDQGLAVTLVEFIGGNRSFSAMIAGKTDLATSSDSVVMFRSFERRDFAVLASFVASDNDIKLLASADGPVRTPADLAGGTVAITPHSASDYFLHSVALMYGLRPGDLDTVAAAPEAMSAQMLEQDRVQALSVWEPYAYQITRALGEKAVLLPTKGLHSTRFTLVVRRSVLQTHPDAMVSFLRAMDRAIEYLHRNPQHSRAIIRDRLGVEPGFLEWVWPDYNFRLGLGHSLLISLDSAARWAVATGAIKPQPLPDFRQLLDSRPLHEVVPNTDDL